MAGRTLTVYLAADTSKFKRGMDDAGNSVDGAGGLHGKITGLGNSLSNMLGPALLAGGLAAGAFAVKMGVDAVQSAGNLNESLSKSGVIFGDVAQQILDFSLTANTALGSTQQAAIDASSTFGQFGKAAGLTGQDLVAFSLQFTTLATDLASFNNTSVDTAIVALGAALRGESEPMRQYGVLMDDNTLKAKALEMGIYDGSGVLTAQQKILAAHQVILAQTGDAQGDFTRTSESLNNQQKIIGSTIADLQTAFGVGFLGAVQASDAASGAEGLTGTMQELKPTITSVGDAVGDTVVAMTDLVGWIGDAKTGWDDLTESMGPAGDVLRTLTDLVLTMKGSLSFLVEQINAAISAYNRLNSVSAHASGPGDLGPWANKVLQ